MRGNLSPSIYATEKYSVVRGITPVRRYLPQKMECINEWNEKNSRERAVQGLAGAIFRGREDGLCVGSGEEAVERGMRAVHVLADDAEADPRAESAG